MFSLQGKKALITGATGGIGQAIAKALHAQGASVYLSGTKESLLKDLAASLKERAYYGTCNLANSTEVQSLVPHTHETMGGLDILVCNAGITRDSLTLRMSNEQFSEVFQVNLLAAFILNREAAILMSKQHKGRIINISSIVGCRGNFGQANYAASKAGLIGMSKSLALEVARRGITVNCIAPGFIKTPMTDVLSDPIKEKIMTSIPLQRMGEAEEIASASVFLASDEASYITGETLHVNGGMHMA